MCGALAVRAALLHGTHRAVESVVRRWKQLQSASADDSMGSGGDDSNRVALSDDNPAAQDLLRWVEDCLFHGLKVALGPAFPCLHKSLWWL